MGFVQIKQPRQQQRPHIRNCRAHRMALFAVQIPKDRWIRSEVKFFHAEFVESLADFWILLTGPGDSRQIAFHVGHEYRHADAAKTFGNDSECYGLSRAGRTGNQAVAIGHLRQQRVLADSFSNAQPFSHEMHLPR